MNVTSKIPSRPLRPERSSAPIVPGRSWTAQEPEKTGSARETGSVFESTDSAQQTLSTSSGAHPWTFEQEDSGRQRRQQNEQDGVRQDVKVKVVGAVHQHSDQPCQ